MKLPGIEPGCNHNRSNHNGIEPMAWISLQIQVPTDYQELLIAELMELDFEGFEQLEEHLVAFIPSQRFSDSSREQIETLLAAWPGECRIETEQVVQEENWNAAWEETIQPQAIGRFLVRPTWARVEPSPGQILLEIDPKMAFGTGYHATTRLMLELLPDLKPEGKRVLDAGTGTGILAIAAAKLGAGQVFGFDIDEWSERNATENVWLNGVNHQVTVALGDESVIPEGSRFDLILANINRNVLLELLPLFSRLLEPGGRVALSGLLRTDRDIILKRAEQSGLHLMEEEGMEEWVALVFRHV